MTLLQISYESNSERILKIGEYLVTLWARVKCLVFFQSQCSSVIPHRSATWSPFKACGDSWIARFSVSGLWIYDNRLPWVMLRVRADCEKMFTARRYASAVYAMALCPSVCLSVSVTSPSSTKTAKTSLPMTSSDPLTAPNYPNLYILHRHSYLRNGCTQGL